METNLKPTTPMQARIAFEAEHPYFSSMCCPRCGNAQMLGDPPMLMTSPASTCYLSGGILPAAFFTSHPNWKRATRPYQAATHTKTGKLRTPSG